MLTNHNYFDILGMDERFTLDEKLLEQKLTELQASVHPDNFSQATAQEKRLMMQYSAMLNEAYAKLKDPIQRAIHLLELRGIVIDNETTQALPPAFLNEQMELREALEEARASRASLKEMEYSVEKAHWHLLKDLASLLDKDQAKNLVPAREKILELQFYTKLLAQIRLALAALETKSVS